MKMRFEGQIFNDNLNFYKQNLECSEDDKFVLHIYM